MRKKTFRKYLVFAVGLVVCVFLAVGLLGYLSLRADTASEEPATLSAASEQTTVPETTAVPTETLSPEEQIFRDYHEASKYRDDESYTIQDLDSNGVPEMLIQRYGSLHEVVTVQNGVVVSVLQGSTLFLCENGVVGQYSEGSGGCTVWFYQLSGAKAESQMCLVWLFEKNTWYTSTDHTGDWDTMQPISEAQRLEIIEKYPPLEEPSSWSFLQLIYQTN